MFLGSGKKGCIQSTTPSTRQLTPRLFIGHQNDTLHFSYTWVQSTIPSSIKKDSTSMEPTVYFPAYVKGSFLGLQVQPESWRGANNLTTKLTKLTKNSPNRDTGFSLFIGKMFFVHVLFLPSENGGTQKSVLEHRKPHSLNIACSIEALSETKIQSAFPSFQTPNFNRPSLCSS